MQRQQPASDVFFKEKCVFLARGGNEAYSDRGEDVLELVD